MSSRWSEEDLKRYAERTRSQIAAAPVVMRAPAFVPQRGSKLEHELLGHLTVMQLQPVQQHKFHPERRWRLDFAFPDVLVGVEVDGAIFNAENGTEAGRHSRGAGQCKDMEKRNAAAELGWLILSYGPPHVRSGEAATQIERIVSARRASGSALAVQLDGTIE